MSRGGRRKVTTVNQFLVKRLGPRRALMVETFVMLWSLYAATEGDDPATIEDLAEAINKGASTVYRWQADFREAFEEVGWLTPRELLDYAQVERARSVTARQVAQFGWSA